jgi:uncharacterized protein YggE
MESQIVVRGSGQARVMPDRAVVRIVVEGEGSSREDAYQEAARYAKQVDEVIDLHRAGIEHVVTAALAVQPKTRWRKGESVRTGWRASRTSILEVTDFSRLGDLFAEAAAAGGTTTGPSWHIDDGNVVYDEVRRLAARQARQRASAYAEALGLEVAGIAWIAEPGLRQAAPTHEGAPMGRGLVASAAPMGAGEDVIDITPDEVVVEAAVEVGFTFADPSRA